MTTPLKSRTRLRRALLSLIIASAIVVSILWYIGVLGGNVHEVVKDRVYRSAQLTGSNLDTVFNIDHVKTDINLRGGNLSDDWYRSETSSCKLYGVTHIDVPMSASKLPTPDQLDKLIYIFDHAKYPVLFHCKAGSDRSGLVGTLYVNIYQHVPIKQAEYEQLTWRYGHISWGQTHAMNDFYNLYDKTNAGLDLRTWILTKYPAIYKTLVQKQH
jgi:protein tyrosine/serine phosphatase